MMKISFTGVAMETEFTSRMMGYGNAAFEIYKSMNKLGVQVDIDNSEYPINFCFANPGSYPSYMRNQYNIGYSAHESSEILKQWQDNMSNMDELWATSSWTKDVFGKYNNISNVYPHGVSKIFKPSLRSSKDKFIFLHAGEPYERKGGELVAAAFAREFSEDENVVLVFKTYGEHHIKTYHPNISFINKSIDKKEYIKLLEVSNCFVFPSMGEGFGLMVLEALATGMPVISTHEWAEYDSFIHNKITSTQIDTPKDIVNNYLSGHMQGKVYMPDIDSIAKNMRNVYSNYNEQADIHYEQSRKIVKDYSWDNVTENYAIPRLKEIYEVL